jgi:protein SCO1/2
VKRRGELRLFCKGFLTLAVMAIFVAAPALAHNENAAPIASHSQPEMLKNIDIEQRLGSKLPLKTSFRNETGAPVSLQEYFSGKPVLLAFTYFDCPMLCPLVLEGLVRSLRPLSLSVGRDFDIVVISIDEHDNPDGARKKKTDTVIRYGRDGTAAGWHFLTGEKSAIEAVTGSAGFTYAWDQASSQYMHASGVFILTPEGKIARVLYGIDYAPRDVRLALVEAANGTIGTAVDQLLLYCYHYDPITGKYGFVIMNSLRAAGVTTVLAIASFIGVMLRRERRAAQTETES